MINYMVFVMFYSFHHIVNATLKVAFTHITKYNVRLDGGLFLLMKSRISNSPMIAATNYSCHLAASDRLSSVSEKMEYTTVEILLSWKISFSIYRQPNLPSKRLELTLNKFTTVALPVHLNMINQHTANIERVSDCVTYVINN